MRQRLEFSYQISDERLLAWAQRPIIERLQMLDDLRLFTLAARAAPTTVEARRHADSEHKTA
jgi:hypothetical protein